MTNTAALIKETIRLANRDHGVWVSSALVAAQTKNAVDFEPETVAAELGKLLRLTVAQAADALDAALDRSVDAMNAAADIEITTGTPAEDTHPAMLEVYAADDAVTKCESDFIRVAAYKALELAADYAPAERAAVAEMFAPALENRIEDYTGEMRAKLTAKAYALAACI